jgi:hypothetical protein
VPKSKNPKVNSIIEESLTIVQHHESETLLLSSGQHLSSLVDKFVSDLFDRAAASLDKSRKLAQSIDGGGEEAV